MTNVTKKEMTFLTSRTGAGFCRMQVMAEASFLRPPLREAFNPRVHKEEAICCKSKDWLNDTGM